MNAIRKIAATGLLAACLAATGLGVTNASAFEGRGIYFGIVAGSYDDEGEAYRRPFYGTLGFEHRPVCHLGHARLVWEELCKPVGYAVNYCWHAQVSVRPEICN